MTVTEGPIANTKPQWQPAVLVGKSLVAPETVSLRLEAPEPLNFIPGQYVNLRVEVPGRPRPIQRAYSIGSSPLPPSNVVEVIVNKLDDGLVSPILVNETAVGDTFPLRGPYGSFIYTDKSDLPLFLIAAGSGVVPYLSIIRFIHAAGLKVPTTLLFSSRTKQHAIAADELSELEARAGWFTFVQTFTRNDSGEHGGYQRRIDAEMLNENGVKEAGSIYVCGPPTMVDWTVEQLGTLGIDEIDVLTERYV